MPASRHLPTEEAVDLLRLVRDLVTNELLPLAASAEAEERFPREVFLLLGRTGLLGLPYDEEHGGGGQPYEVYLQVLEEIAVRLGERRGGRQRARTVLLRAGDRGHRRPTTAVAARHARR